MRSISVGVATLLLAALSGAAAAGPVKFDRYGEPYPETATSFDCKKAATYAERTICSDKDLAYADAGIDWTYRRLLLHSPHEAGPAITKTQRAWLRERRDACGDIACLREVMEARERELSAALDAHDAALRRNVREVGACEVTRLDFLAGRFDTDPPQGTSVGYANGVWQVDYDRVPAALRSRVGDPVRVCLVKKPRHCPPGDNRGWTYSSHNLRTGARWTMWNALHSCGGA